MLNFFLKIIDALNTLKIPYMLSGSVAMGIYTLPRATRDFDFVVHLQLKDVEAFTTHFKEGYYCDTEAVKDAIKHHSIFNVIDHASGYKADFVILKNEPFRQLEFTRRKEIEYLDKKIFVVSAEDLLLSKLIWIQDYQSAVQTEDIKSILASGNLDLDYIREWVAKLNLKTFNLL
jgi:hypothetical protein